jgi:hypothetical protein
MNQARPLQVLLCDIYGLVLVGRPLSREDGSVFFMCCWPLPAQSVSGPSPLGLETIFYCLRLETSLSSPPTTRRVTVEVFDPASTRESLHRSESVSINVYANVSLCSTTFMLVLGGTV